MPDEMLSPADVEIVSTRDFNVPVDQLYRAWTDPAHLQNWWGPAGFTNTFHEYDLRPGGKWRFVMHGPEQGHYVNECEFIQVEPPHLLSWKRHSKPLFHVVVTFEAIAVHQARVVFRMIFDTVKECNKVKPFAVEKNEENFDRLELELLKMK